MFHFVLQTSARRFCAIGVAAALLQITAHAGFSPVWTLGVQDGTTDEFGQEDYGGNPPPGSATVLDDDYYFAGSFAAPIGNVATAEPVANFERAITTDDPTNRIHFNLTASQAASTARFRITFTAIWGGWWNAPANAGGAGFGTHSVTVKMNGATVGTRVFTEAGLMIVTVNASQVSPVAGANVVELVRTGGSPNAWLGLDFVAFEADPTGLLDADGDGLPQWWEEDHGLSDANAADAAADIDGDGLTALQEFARGTDPRLADTDGDGLKDNAEISAGTDPLVADTDGDGLSDGEELALSPSTNPLLADTDSDGAPDAWEVRVGTNPTSAASVPPAFPGAIGITFRSADRTGVTLGPLEVTGWVPQMRWNNTRPLVPWDTPSGTTADIASPTSGVLVNSSGANSGMTLSWTSPDNSGNSGNYGGANQKLLDGYLTTYSAAPVSVSLGAIPFATYNVIVYTGSYYDGARGFVRLNNLATNDRYFSSGSALPERELIEPFGSTAARPWRGNTVVYRNVTGASCNIKLNRVGDDLVGIHAIQIVNATPDTDGDGMPDWWELSSRLRADLASDAALDPDADGLTNLQEYQRRTNPRLADTDGDGLKDNIETNTGTYVSATNTGTNPLLPDTDGDGLTDGAEVNVHRTNPLLTDTDGDGRTDADEVAHGTDPALSTTANYGIPTVTTVSPRTFAWVVSNVQLVWDHERGHVADGMWDEEMLTDISIVNPGGADWEAMRMGLRVRNGKIAHFFFSNHLSAFSTPGDPNGDIWESDWTPANDLRAALGFSGYGRADISNRLLFRVNGTSTTGQNGWTITFSLINADTSVVAATQTFTGCTLATNVFQNTATWTDDTGTANRLTIRNHAGVTTWLQRTTRLDDTVAFAAFKDTDKDGMPDVWEDAKLFNKNSAADAAQDADSDGLSNLREYLAGTNPRLADTDGDGVKDGPEATGGSDPLSAASKPQYFNGLPGGIAGEDLNGNGIPDAFELWSGNFSLQAGADHDGDGFTDAQEAAAGTDPLSAASRPWSALSRQSSNAVLSWPLLPMKRHQVWQSTDLTNWTLAPGAPSAVGNEYRQTFANAVGATPKFYRVGIQDQDTDGDGVSDWTEQMVLGSNPANANSLHAALPIDTNGDGVPDSTVTGDYVTLIERLQGATASGGFPSGNGASGSGISRAQAARFLAQATFGPTVADIERVQQLGFSAWLNEQIAKPATLHATYMKAIVADLAGPRVETKNYSYNDSDFSVNGNNAQTAFARAAITGEDQLRQRIAFALSQILVASRRDANLTNRPLGMADFYDIFVRNAFGNYRDVLTQVALHPCMGRYLSHVGNQKADPSINRFPDENFAREVMQLFSIGLWQLNPDGTRQVNALGQNIPTYSNTEITQTARVFTGLWFGGRNWGNGGYQDPDYATPMTMHADRHDFGPKTLVGGAVIPARAPTDAEGMRDVTDALRILFEHPNTAPFISRQLIQFLVTDNPSPAYVQRVSTVFANNGSGVRGDLAAVAKAILLDAEARNPNQAATFGRLKDPVHRTMALARAFGMKNSPGLLWWDFGEFYEFALQSPGYSPSVFNFYRPDYRAPGLLTQQGLAGPVFQITDSYSSIAFPNKLWDFVTDGFRLYEVYKFPLDLTRPIALAATPDSLLDEMSTLFFNGQMSAGTRAIIRNAITQIPATEPEARARVAAYLSAVAPEAAILK